MTTPDPKLTLVQHSIPVLSGTTVDTSSFGV